MGGGAILPTPERPGRRHTSFSPTQLRIYRECPERYYRRYLRNERVTAPFNRGTQRGSAAHKALADAFRRRQQGEVVETIAQAAVERYLPRPVYAKGRALDAWDEDVVTALGCAEVGLERIAADATVLDVERSFRHVRSSSSAVAGVTLVGLVDLVVRHRAGIVEQIEFKTGWAQPEELQTTICRIGVCEAHAGLGLPVLSTTLQLTSGEEYAADGDRATLGRVLGGIEATILEIWAAGAWPARKNEGCRFCEYWATTCSLRTRG